MAHAGPLNLITDISGLQVGQAEDPRVATGVSVIVPDQPAIGAVMVAGGGPGTRETDLLAAGTLVDSIDAICLSGGSAFGLAAADGVASGLKADGKGFGLVTSPGVPKTPLVPGAILYDLANGGDKDWGEVSPYAGLGRAAYEARSRQFELGRAGAGYGATAGMARGGTGSASFMTDDGLDIGALAAVNSFGSVYMPGTDVFWAWPYEMNGEFGSKRPPADFAMDPEDWGAAKRNPALGQNTTIACIATSVALTPDQAKRVAAMALSGLSRAIRPVFAPTDGDVVFVLSTALTPLPDPAPYHVTRLGELAAAALARAIARGVYESN